MPSKIKQSLKVILRNVWHKYLCGKRSSKQTMYMLETVDFIHLKVYNLHKHKIIFVEKQFSMTFWG